MDKEIPLKAYYLALAEGIKFLEFKIIDVHRVTTYKTGKGFQDLRRAVSETPNYADSPLVTIDILAGKLEQILNIRTEAFDSTFKETSVDDYVRLC